MYFLVLKLLVKQIPFDIFSYIDQNRKINTSSKMEANPNNGYYSLGLQTCKVPMSLFDKNRKRLAAALRENANTPSNAVVLLQAGGEQGIKSV